MTCYVKKTISSENTNNNAGFFGSVTDFFALKKYFVHTTAKIASNNDGVGATIKYK